MTAQKDNFFKYVGLNIAGMLGLSCYILADTLFVSAAMGANGLAALNIAIAVYSLIQALGLLLGIGGATRCAIALSQGKQKEGRQIFAGTILAGLTVGLLLFITGLALTPAIASLLGADSTIHGMTVEYLRVILCFSPFFIGNNVLLAFVRNDKNPKLSMAAMLAGSFANIILDYVFIFPLSMGMFGAAFATGLAPIISMGILSLHWFGGKERLRPKFSSWSVRGILPLGLSSFVTELSSGIVLAVFNLVILGLAGNTGVAAYGVIANLALIVIAVFTGLGQGIQPLVSRAWGKQDFKALAALRRNALLLAFGLGLFFCLIGNFFASPLIALFNQSGDSTLRELAARGMLLYFPGFLFAGINVCTAALFSAENRPKPAFLVSITRGCAAVLPLVALLPPFLHMDGVWLSFTLAELTACCLSLIFLRKQHKNQINTNLPC